MQIEIFEHPPMPGYELLDCGHGEKLERFGDWTVRRPDPQAMWRPRAEPSDWDRADLTFVRESDRGGHWKPTSGRRPPESWTLDHGPARFVIRPTPFKHVGLFPEQASNWTWTAERVAALRDAGLSRPALLNLFAYTGAATVTATQAGAFVTHVDASRPALKWARENAAASGLADDAVRWIEDDAARFVQREVRRGRRYHGVLLDPPPYGRGPKGEKWEFEQDVTALLSDVRTLLADGPAFIVLSCYAVGTSPLAFHNMLADLFPAEADLHISAGELALPQSAGGTGETADGAGKGRLLPAGLCGRWRRGL